MSPPFYRRLRVSPFYSVLSATYRPLKWQQCGSNRGQNGPGRKRTSDPMETSFPLYLSHMLLLSRAHTDAPPGTRNPVVREHRVGSSPTSGTQGIPAKRRQIRTEKRSTARTPGFYYTNALGKRILHRFGGTVPHGGEYV